MSLNSKALEAAAMISQVAGPPSEWLMKQTERIVTAYLEEAGTPIRKMVRRT